MRAFFCFDSHLPITTRILPGWGIHSMTKRTSPRKAPVMVRTSRNRLEPFDSQKIIDSLILETGIDRAHAEKIAATLERDVKRLSVTYLTAPLIREIVNVKLLEAGFESARKRYTRLGMPVYDTTRLLEDGAKNHGSLQHTPEAVHHLMGDVVAREYTYVHLLPPKLVDEHMRGRIHIHDLNYFATRPFAFSHDLRFFLEHGLKVDGTGTYAPAAGPPKKPEVAFLQAARILAASQKNCAGGSSIPHFNTFLAPYVTGLSYKDIVQLAQLFVYELSQIYPAGAKETVFPSLNLDLTIPQCLTATAAVTPHAHSKNTPTYADYSDEADRILAALVDVLAGGDHAGRPFPYPRLEIHTYHPKKDASHPLWEPLARLSAATTNPAYVYHRTRKPPLYSYQSDSYFIPLRRQSETNLDDALLTGGILQVAAVNLPQLALDAQGNEKRFYAGLTKTLAQAKTALLTKKNLMAANIQHQLLPFLGQPVSTYTNYFNEKNQHLVFGFLGLTQAVKVLAGSHLHEDTSARRLGAAIVDALKNTVAGYRRETGFNFMLSASTRNTTALRTASLDGRRFDLAGIADVDPVTGAPSYTPSFQVAAAADIPLKKRLAIEARFQRKITHGGCLCRPRLTPEQRDPEQLADLLAHTAKDTTLKHLGFHHLPT